MLRLDRYDNEAGYSKRMAELCNIVAAQNITKTTPDFQYE
jgi:glyceraldehyde 3-phosphate dehydrogenase